MPPRTFALELSRTSSYVCQSCIASIGRARPSPQPWLTRNASSAARAARRQRAPTTTKQLEEEQAQRFQEALLREAQKGEPTDTDEGPTEPLAVNYFNEETEGQYRQLRDGAEFGAVSGGIDSEISEAINDLEQKMVQTIQMLDSLEKVGGSEQDKAEELRKQFKKILREKYKGKTGPEGESYGVLRIPGFSGVRQRAVANLNSFLARDSVVKGGVPKPKDLFDCWKYYSAARSSLATQWTNVPREVWDFLWMILSHEGEGVENPNRMHHIYVLAKDMQAAGVVLRDSQQLLAIEAMFLEGWQEEAIEAWKKAVVTIGSKPETFKGYYELGVRMCSLHGDTDRAMRAADTLLKSSESPNPRIMIPIVRALAAKEENVEEAWEVYRDMRALLGDTMQIEDYDEVIACFLAVNHIEHALQAFVDMMFSGPMDIRGKTRLPTIVGNHFFLGKWLKRLIGAGDLDGAYKVVTFLQKKGVAASPIQLNGLVGAWLRTETADNVEKADQLAWAMIKARLDFVDLRRRAAAMDRPIRLVPRDGEPTSDDYICTTRATVETFSLLAENYSARGLHDELEELWTAFELAELGPNSFMINQIIKSYTESKGPQEAIDFYEQMTKKRHVRPDAHTFIALYNTLSVNRVVRRDNKLTADDAVIGRQFFQDLVKMDWKFDSVDEYTYLPRTVLFSMLKAKDHAGMIVAARTMKELFSYSPPEQLLIELAAGTATLRVQSKRNMDRIMEASRLIESLIRKHTQVFADLGGDPAKMTTQEKDNQLCAVFEELVLVKAHAQNAERSAVNNILAQAAEEMGVFEIVFTRDPAVIRRYRKVMKNKDVEDDVD
ncbi:hypothetical protein B0T13DRAFT_482847 [Neurospora crassa]|nr:hypothetical protein B0T13DRAFT_482847 [Neurospora crassa]